MKPKRNSKPAAKARPPHSRMPALHADEWEFHRIEDHDLALALEWELQREAGNGLRRWLGLKEPEKERVRCYWRGTDWPVRDLDWIAYGNQEQFAEFSDVHVGAGSPARRHILEIDWSADRDLLRQRFEALIAANAVKPEKKGGRKRDLGMKLVKLAALRAVTAGFTRPDAKSKLCPLLKWAGLKLKANNPDQDPDGGGIFSEHHFPSELKKIRTIVATRKGSPFKAVFPDLSTPKTLKGLPAFARLPLDLRRA